MHAVYALRSTRTTRCTRREPALPQRARISDAVPPTPLGSQSHRLDGSRHLNDGGKIMTNRHTGPTVVERSRPLTIQHAKELQHYGTVARLPIALDVSVCS